MAMPTVTMMWLLIATGTTVAVISDMRRLRVHRVGLSSVGWLIVCVGAGPFAIAAYLICRRLVWQRLVDSVWKIVGDGSHPIDVRRKRLIALHCNGVIGVPVFQACLKALIPR